jgi:hypothetical protein
LFNLNRSIKKRRQAFLFAIGRRIDEMTANMAGKAEKSLSKISKINHDKKTKPLSPFFTVPSAILFQSLSRTRLPGQLLPPRK